MGVSKSPAWRLRLRRQWPFVAALGLLAPLIVAGAVALDAFGLASADLSLEDALVRTWRGDLPRSKDVVILAIDDATLEAIDADPELRFSYGSWPYARSLWANVINRLATYRVRAVVMDAVFAQGSSDEGEDRLFADMLARKKSVPVFAGLSTSASLDEARAKPAEVAALTLTGGGAAQGFEPLVRTGPDGQRVGTVVPRPAPPPEALLGAFAGLGLVRGEADADGKLRRTRFLARSGGKTYGSLALVAAKGLLGGGLSLEPGRLTVGSRVVPLDASGRARLDFGGPVTARFDSIGLIHVLTDRTGALASRFLGKVVVIGGFALATADVHDTPFERAAPGVVKPATELDGLLTGRFLSTAPGWAMVLVAMLVSLAGAAAVVGARWWPVELVAPFAVLALVQAGLGLALRFGAVTGSVLVPTLAGVVACLGAVVVNRFHASKERETLERTFGRYMEKALVDLVVEGGDLGTLEAKTAEVTVFFSDVRGFATISETLRARPEVLREVLNVYLTRVTAALVGEGACIDKYIGDAVVALFGAPVPQPDHAARACRAALAVKQAVDALKLEFAAKGWPDMSTRIGLNTGELLVGNFGSDQLTDYTAIGDGMNVAARLEGANKFFHTSILAGPRTAELARDEIAFRELDTVRVAGRGEALAVFEVCGPAAGRSTAAQRLAERYALGLAHYRAGRFAEAVTALEGALNAVGTDGPTEALLSRCRAYLQSPPSPFEPITSLTK